MQAHDLSKDHKPDLEEEKERILKAGGFIQSGRINGSLNLARAIGDMEFKKRKDLPPEKQMVTANPDVKIVCNNLNKGSKTRLIFKRSNMLLLYG